MDRFRAFVRAGGYVLATFYVLGAAALSFKLVFQRPATLDLRWVGTPLGTVLLYLSGSLATLLGLFFFLKLWDHIHKRRWFQREGAQGPIQVSPFAVQDFIQALLAREERLGRSRVSLHHGPEGSLDVELSVNLPLDVAVVDTSERLQQLLKHGVEEQLGISVHRVSVYAQRIDVPDARKKTDTSPSAQDEQTDEVGQALEEHHDEA